MNNDYNDFKLLSDEKLNELVVAYHNKLGQITTSSIEDDFTHKFSKLIDYINLSLHYLNNLVVSSKNKEIFDELIIVKDKLLGFKDDLNLLYEIEIEPKKEEIEQNFSNNESGFIDSFVCFLQILFDFINFESNGKIKISLSNIFTECLEIIKLVNGLQVSNYKIFSLFKKR